MKTAFVIFDRMTALDFIGAYDPLTRLKSMDLIPNFEWDICALAEEVADDKGLRFTPSVVAEPLSKYDLIVVPGGFGTRTLQHDRAFIDWIRTSAPVKLKASACAGALLLGTAGFLKGKRATTHPSAFEELKPYCAKVVNERSSQLAVSQPQLISVCTWSNGLPAWKRAGEWRSKWTTPMNGKRRVRKMPYNRAIDSDTYSAPLLRALISARHCE